MNSLPSTPLTNRSGSGFVVAKNESPPSPRPSEKRVDPEDVVVEVCRCGFLRFVFQKFFFFFFPFFFRKKKDGNSNMASSAVAVSSSAVAGDEKSASGVATRSQRVASRGEAERVLEWAGAQPQGDRLAGRYGHTAVVHENSLFFFGGDGTSKRLNTVVRFDVDANT
jgi:hypothetical protein